MNSYIFPEAGQTAEPNGLKFVVNTHGYLGDVIGSTNRFFPRATPGPSAMQFNINKKI